MLCLLSVSNKCSVSPLNPGSIKHSRFVVMWGTKRARSHFGSPPKQRWKKPVVNLSLNQSSGLNPQFKRHCIIMISLLQHKVQWFYVVNRWQCTTIHCTKSELLMNSLEYYHDNRHTNSNAGAPKTDSTKTEYKAFFCVGLHLPNQTIATTMSM